MKTPEQLAEEHWEWVKGLIKSSSCDYTDETLEYIYTTAFIHGYKHGLAANTPQKDKK